jgi:uncharacterized protein (TIGR00369 family)
MPEARKPGEPAGASRDTGPTKRPWSELGDRERHGRTMDFTFTKIPYVVDLGIELLDWSMPDVVRVRLPYHPRMDNSSGTHHGGVIAALVDTAGSAAAWNGHDYSRGRRGLTVSLTVNFIDRAGESTLIAVGRCLRRGARLSFIEVSVEAEDGRPVASGSLVYQFHE